VPPKSTYFASGHPPSVVRSDRLSLIEAAERALPVDEPECRELAEQLLRKFSRELELIALDEALR
jgi:hypothetical protein